MKYIYIMLLVCSGLPALAQKHFSFIDEYRFAERKGEEKMVVLAMPIGRHDIVSFTGDTAALRSAGALIIDIVCTDFPSNASLTALNQRRFDELFLTFPFLKTNSVQQVNCFRQLKGNTSANAAKMFHGLVIKFRTAQSPVTIKSDLQKLDELLEAALPPASSEETKEISTGDADDMDAFEVIETLRKGAKISSDASISVHQEGRYVIVDPRHAVPEMQKMGLLKTDSVKWIRGREIYSYFTPGSPFTALLQKSNVEVPLIITDKPNWYEAVIGGRTSKKANRLDIDSIGKKSYKPTLPDSTILKTFERNKHWNNMVVLADVTGSMYPYSAQLLIWIRMNLEANKSGDFVFFNDGDNRSVKPIGSSGGIYSQRCSTFEETRELVKHVMRKGNGGDIAENNIEALLQAEKDFPDARFNVMIADNWAPIKDKILSHRLTKPVRIVLCGVYENGVNVEYLNLARLTKGSVHLMEQDLTNIALMNEGETLQIGNRRYKVLNGVFEDITDERKTFRKL